jgi:dethiobiotin synthetase
MTAVLVTGTDTGIGKTVATAAMVATDLASGRSVSVVKPVQTGASTDEPPDATTISRLSGCADSIELVRLDDPLAPDTAARLREVDIPPVRTLADVVGSIARGFDVTYVEGAGGVKVRLDANGGTLLDLGQHLVRGGRDVVVVVVTGLALGTLNHTELTVDAIRAAGLEPAGLVLGDVPKELGLAERCNLDELPRVTGLPVIAAIPHGAGAMSPEEFRHSCGEWIRPGW